MPGPHDEQHFESAVVHELTTWSGWQERPAGDYDRHLRLVPADLETFLRATQPDAVDQLIERLGDGWLRKTCEVLTRSLKRPGDALKLLRRGKNVHGVQLSLAYFKPTHGLNPDVVARYDANVLTVIRQVPYSPEHGNTVDVGLFVNGLPVADAELKNGTSQRVGDAVEQYRRDRDPRDTFLSRRSVVHFAADPYFVRMTTALAGSETRFLPFDRGSDLSTQAGAGNYQPADGSHPTSYLWRQAFQRDAWMDLLASFIHVEPDPDDPLAAPTMIFPRFHQWDCVLRFVDDARQHGAGRNYLAMHSTGSGKTNTIGWLAHRLANLFDADDRKVFDKVIVLTDRTVLDRQLQDKIEQFEQVNAVGMVRAISDSSQQLREALESSSAKVIVSTIQKFPYISSSLTDRRGERFAIVIDEAHSSQSGESSAAVKRALAPSRTESEETLLAQAAEEEARYEAAEPDPTLAAAEAARARGPQDNLSMFAFTATPKNRTLELFGDTEPATGHKRPSHVYSMRQAIEEGFILDVLQNYTTYDTYYRLATATVQWDSETVEKSKALAAVRRFAMLHPHNIAQKVAIIVEHFRENVMGGLDGQAKAMVVTASRLHAVRYKHKIDEYLTANGYDDLRALIAFSSEVIDPDGDPDQPYTEAHMNGFPEGQTTKRFDSDDYQVMVVAEKYQTGFDQPKLCAMYVDKKLAGVNVVQTFSRLNRPLPGKTTFILDFVNDVDTIRDAYADYWTEALAEPTDPQALYETWERLDDYHVLDDEDVDRFAAVWFDPTFDPMATSDDKKKAARKHQQLTDALAPAEKRFAALAEEQQDEFRSVLNQFVRMYSFLAQVLPWSDPGLEKRHAYARLLSRRVADERGKALDLSDELEMTHYHLQQSFHGKVEPGDSEVIGPTFSGSGHGALTEEEQAALAEIIARINHRFGAGLDEQHRVIAEGMAHHVLADEDARSKLAANPQDKAWIAFEQMWSKAKYAYLDEHTEFIKTLVGQPEIEKMLGKAVFDYVYREARRRQSQDIEGEPSAT